MKELTLSEGLKRLGIGVGIITAGLLSLLAVWAEEPHLLGVVAIMSLIAGPFLGVLLAWIAKGFGSD